MKSSFPEDEEPGALQSLTDHLSRKSERSRSRRLRKNPEISNCAKNDLAEPRVEPRASRSPGEHFIH